MGKAEPEGKTHRTDAHSDLEIPHLVGLLDTLAYLPKCKGDKQPFVKAFTSC